MAVWPLSLSGTSVKTLQTQSVNSIEGDGDLSVFKCTNAYVK